ncbi:MAG: hypothetical protein JNM84_23860 [Planctomycetes bacterium]|nr:hypothetical protein [Planctomycetota bacterium]
MNEPDPLLEALRSERAFASDRERIARAAQLAAAARRPSSHAPRRYLLGFAALAAALCLAWLGWWFASTRETSRGSAAVESADAQRFTEIPPELAELLPADAAAPTIAFLAPTHDVFVLSAERAPRILMIERAEARGD